MSDTKTRIVELNLVNLEQFLLLFNEPQTAKTSSGKKIMRMTRNGIHIANVNKKLRDPFVEEYPQLPEHVTYLFEHLMPNGDVYQYSYRPDLDVTSGVHMQEHHRNYCRTNWGFGWTARGDMSRTVLLEALTEFDIHTLPAALKRVVASQLDENVEKEESDDTSVVSLKTTRRSQIVTLVSPHNTNIHIWPHASRGQITYDLLAENVKAALAEVKSADDAVFDLKDTLILEVA